MSYRASFLDNQVVGVDDFNGIVSNLIGAGVVTASFTSTESYMISKMNDVTRDAVMTAGVVPVSESSLRCTLSGTTLSIAIGSAVFASGVSFRVTEAEQMQIESGRKQYVYLAHDKTQNTAMPYISAEGFPNESDTLYIVKLCEADEAGNITDRREYARGRLQAPSDWNGTKAQTMNIPLVEDIMHGFDEDVILNVGGDRINFLVFVSTQGIGVVTEPNYGEFEIMSFGNETTLSRNSVILKYSKATNSTFSISGFRRGESGELICRMKSDVTTTSTITTYTLYSSVYYEGAEG